MSEVLVKGVVPLSFIPSVNAMYERSSSGVKLTSEYSALREEVLHNLNFSSPDSNHSLTSDPLQVTLGYYCTSGIGKRDLDNMNKHFIDSLAIYFGFNDNQIYDLYCYKREIRYAPSCFVYYKIERHPKPKSAFIIQWNELKNIFETMKSNE
jgi:Holliday junction resolvase RusA-like endonuclease